MSYESFARAEHYHVDPTDGAEWPFAGESPAVRPPDPELDAPATPRRILIVEDSRPLRELYRVVLEASGYLVSTAEDGVTGLAVALREQPDLLMVDISLPGKDGVTMLAELRQAERSRRRAPAPALLLSASPSFP
ncbi:MAG TPA: response regulator, partial [Ktedonobacterales bacterium]|nr:response regulator [Ktedonobacterales bacterium]